MGVKITKITSTKCGGGVEIVLCVCAPFSHSSRNLDYLVRSKGG